MSHCFAGQPKEIRAFILDFDGVILESACIKTDAFATLFADETEDVRRQILTYHLEQGGLSRWVKFHHIYDNILQHSISEAGIQVLGKRFQDLVFEKVLAAPLVPGTIDFLESIRSLVPLYIVSGAPKEELDYILSRRFLQGYFQEVFGAPTPKVDSIKTILEWEQICPDAAVFVGDTLSDYEAATASGVLFVARRHVENAYFSGISCPQITDLAELYRMWKTGSFECAPHI